MKTLAILLLKSYQLIISPIFHLLGVRCRFHQTCSNYSIAAIKKHGLLKGLTLTTKRLINCHPFNNKNYFDSIDD